MGPGLASPDPHRNGGSLDRERLAASCLVAALPARVLLDVVHTVSPAVARVGGGLLAVGVLACAAATLGRWRSRPLGGLALAWTALVLVAAVRAADMEALRLTLLYLSAPAYGLAVSAILTHADRERLVMATAATAAIPVAWSCVDRLAAPDLILHDYPRWLGGYASHHAHALAMAVFTLLGLHLGATGRRAGWLLAVGAAVALASTWVRTAWLMVVVTVVVATALRARARTAAAALGTAVLGACLHPAVRHRFSDVGAVLTLRAPEGGWEALGSWRGRIWLESVEAFAAHGPFAWVTGLGLGAHDGLYRELDPHHEYLAALFQMGVAGPALLVALLVVALREAVRARATPLGAAAAGLIVAVGLLGAVSNVLLERPLVGMALWGLVGMAVSAGRGGADEGGRAAPR